jgi:hypothetical protein
MRDKIIKNLKNLIWLESTRDITHMKEKYNLESNLHFEKSAHIGIFSENL